MLKRTCTSGLFRAGWTQMAYDRGPMPALPVSALVEVVYAGLTELRGELRYDVIDVFYIDGGWCARLLRRTDRVQQDVCVDGDTGGRTFRHLVDQFRVGMDAHVWPNHP